MISWCVRLGYRIGTGFLICSLLGALTLGWSRVRSAWWLVRSFTFAKDAPLAVATPLCIDHWSRFSFGFPAVYGAVPVDMDLLDDLTLGNLQRATSSWHVDSQLRLNQFPGSLQLCANCAYWRNMSTWCYSLCRLSILI